MLQKLSAEEPELWILQLFPAQELFVVFGGRPEEAFWGPFLQEPDFLSQLGSTILWDRQEGVTFCL